MRRTARTRLAGAALALAVTGGLAACTGTSGGGEADSEAGDATAAVEPAPPGKFRTLPEPCGAVSRETLEKLLPGAAAKAEEAEKEDADGAPSATPSPLDGEAALTHDTDRRVGCTWQSTTSLGSRQLTVDFERIVSYDAGVSDDEQAEKLFDERAEQAGVGEGSPGTDEGEDEAEADATGGEHTGDAQDGNAPEGDARDRDAGRNAQAMSGGQHGSEHTGEPGGKADDAPKDDEPTGDHTDLASPSPKPSLPPRTLEDIGDDAFIDDRLRTTADGRGSQRDITLVFRTSNVLVTVGYSQSIADAHRTPASAELQKYAQNLARQLAEQFSEG